MADVLMTRSMTRVQVLILAGATALVAGALHRRGWFEDRRPARATSISRSEPREETERPSAIQDRRVERTDESDAGADAADRPSHHGTTEIWGSLGVSSGPPQAWSYKLRSDPSLGGTYFELVDSADFPTIDLSVTDEAVASDFSLSAPSVMVIARERTRYFFNVWSEAMSFAREGETLHIFSTPGEIEEFRKFVDGLTRLGQTIPVRLHVSSDWTLESVYANVHVPIIDLSFEDIPGDSPQRHSGTFKLGERDPDRY